MQCVYRITSLLAFVGASLALSGCSDHSNAAVPTATRSRDTSIRVAPRAAASVDENPGLIDPTDESTPNTRQEPTDPTPERIDQALLGTWQLYEHGTRTIIVNPDGSATLRIESDFLTALIYGPEMTMNLEWSVNDGVLAYSIVDGTPQASVARVVEDYGDERSYRVIEIRDQSIKLEDISHPGSFYDWTRVGESTTSG